MEKLRIMIVEDDELMREQLLDVLDQSPECRCVGAFPSGEAALEEVTILNPQIILMDVGLPGMNGIECLRQIKLRLPTACVIMLTVFEDDNRIFDSILAGADGYLLKRTPLSTIVASLLDVRNSGAPMTSQVARRVLDMFREAPHRAETQGLTKRETEILDQIARGYSHKQIAINLFISPGTVRIHLKNIYHKLHVHSKTEAVSKIFNLRALLK